MRQTNKLLKLPNFCFVETVLCALQPKGILCRSSDEGHTKVITSLLFQLAPILLSIQFFTIRHLWQLWQNENN